MRHIWILCFYSLLALTNAHGETCLKSDRFDRVKCTANGQYLYLDGLTDSLIHFEVSAVGAGPSLDDLLWSSPMVAKRDYPGANRFDLRDNRIETDAVTLTINPANLCLSLFDKARREELTVLCPVDLDKPDKALSIKPGPMKHVYGLGQHFSRTEDADGDWVGRVWEPGAQGNVMRSFAGGAPTVVQIPVMYALGGEGQNYALFLDHVYRQRWDFTVNNFKQWWRLDTWGDQLRGYLMAGKNLPALRSQFMELVGKPLVPPKKVFGYWTSEFGFDSWEELDGVLAGLKAKGFPVDGAAMDLEWYGGKFDTDPASGKMGSLEFDLKHFPDPKSKIASLKKDEGIDLMLIEQSYIGDNQRAHRVMTEKGLLVKDCNGCGPTFLDPHRPWFWKGGMIDWTNPAAGRQWHDLKRKALMDLGVHGHWTDLGEPEIYNGWAKYHGFPELGKFDHGDIHNIYNLKWSESIFRGYEENKTRERFYSMARAGAAGMQRFGAGMWSGDVGANMGSLRAHIHSHGDMSFAGMDYYSSDIGGFHRGPLDGDLQELYTQWFAVGALLDIPVRTHVWNQDNQKPSTPDRVGNLQSNLENLRLRYELLPYYYSLAHRANRFGEPMLPPLVYYYQDDPNVRQMGNEVLIGKDLLFAVVANYGERERDVYLPAGTWVDFYSNRAIKSRGEKISNVPIYRDGRFKLPLYARAGAIIPKMRVGKESINALGFRKGQEPNTDLVARVFAGTEETSFVVFEDDGVSVAYREGKVRTTKISQRPIGRSTAVTIAAASGDYEGASRSRVSEIQLVTNVGMRDVRVTGISLPRRATLEDFQAHENGFFADGRGVVFAKRPAFDVARDLTFEFLAE